MRTLPNWHLAGAQPVDNGPAADADDVMIDDDRSQVPREGFVLEIMKIHVEELCELFARVVVVVQEFDHVLAILSLPNHRGLLRRAHFPEDIVQYV